MPGHAMPLAGLVALAVGLRPLSAGDELTLRNAVARPVVAPHAALGEVMRFAETRIPASPEFSGADPWPNEADGLRRRILDEVVFRGAAAGWRDYQGGVEWRETISGGEGYEIRKLRYEALPGMWIPALLYEPEELTGRIPVVLNVNGHDRQGKSADYKQIRCINLARRGMLALNVEWFQMGQLRTEGFDHDRAVQIDLCGTSGLAPYLLTMTRGIDVLLSHEHADPERVAVAGLSGGGWQSIVLAALDPRVTLSNPVAGFGSLKTGVRVNDIGDFEQTPTDLCRVADYDHLTALVAPRALLLTYNARDECCFRADHTLPPLLERVWPIYNGLGRSERLRWHVNYTPGTHNFQKDNREAFYRMLGDHFFAGDPDYVREELDSTGEIKSAEELDVVLPDSNVDFHTIALELSRSLPLDGRLPENEADARAWQSRRRDVLRRLTAFRTYGRRAERAGNVETAGETSVRRWRLRLDAAWSLPVVELWRGDPQKGAVVVADAGRETVAAQVERLLVEGYRVFAADLLYCGELQVRGTPKPLQYLTALLLNALGERPLGIQSGQAAALTGWARERTTAPVRVVAVGRRTSLATLVACGATDMPVETVELYGGLASLKQPIEENLTARDAPELFCFGLLEALDVRHMLALAAPRRVRILEPDDRARAEFKDLAAWYALYGVDFDPLHGSNR